MKTFPRKNKKQVTSTTWFLGPRRPGKGGRASSTRAVRVGVYFCGSTGASIIMWDSLRRV